MAVSNVKTHNGCATFMHGSAFSFYKEANMAQGTVKWFNPQKGFGFIQPDNGGADVFVHISAVEAAGLRGLNEGQKVSFDIVTERGKSAAGNLKTV
jgi:CspA family cold shock protein